MLEIKALASGSTGNLYTLSDGRATIMLDCGLPFREIERLAGYNLPEAVLVTHEHKDHSKAAADFLRLGADVYMTAGTAEALELSSHNLHICKHGISFQIGGIKVAPFGTRHDAAEPVGFVISDGEDRVLYATDTYYLRWKFSSLTKIMVEANHSYEILRENVEEGRLDERLMERLTKSHFSIENVLGFLAANDLSQVREIWLIHLSDNNADPELFQHMVAAATGKPVYVAGKRGLAL